MLRHIHPLLGPDLLAGLRRLGHGDEVAVVDANFPAHSFPGTVVRLDGIDAVTAVEAILTHLPLDTFEDAAFRMEVVGDPAAVPPVCAAFQDVVSRLAGDFKVHSIERFAFYDRVRSARLIVATGERRLYGNLILKTGVLPVEDAG